MNKDERHDWAKNNEAIQRFVNPGAFQSVPRTFMRNPGDKATISISAPSGSGKTQMHSIIAEALRATGLEVSDIHEVAGCTERFVVTAPQHCEPVKVDRHPMGLDYYPERTAQACQPTKIVLARDQLKPVESGMEFWPCSPGYENAPPLPVKIQQAHLAAKAQNDMTVACAIASELGRESRDKDDPESLAALMRHVETQSGATLELLKVVQRIGLRQWFEGDYVVLSKADATHICSYPEDNQALWDALDKSGQW